MNLIRHVRYEDFVSLSSDGVRTLDDFRSALDTLLLRMGSPEAHDVLIDLRSAEVGPLPEALLIQAAAELARRGLGISNRLAVVVSSDDEARVDRAAALEAIATHAGLQLRGFTDYPEALDWLSSPG